MIDHMKTPKKKPKAKTAGKRDLSAAVAQVHKRPAKAAKSAPDTDVRKIPDHLLLAAGDEPGRDTFFEHDDSQAPLSVHGRQVYMVMGRKAALPDYRTAEGQRTHRSMMTIPPKLREAVRECFGATSDDDFAITTAIIALADYATLVLRRDQKCLFVESVDPDNDPYAEQRKAARKAVRQVANSKK